MSKTTALLDLPPRLSNRTKTVIILACADPDFLPDLFEIYGKDRPFVLSSAGITEKLTDPAEQATILKDIETVGVKKIGAREVWLVGHTRCKWIATKYGLVGEELDKKQVEILHQAEKIVKAKTTINEIQKIFLRNIDGFVVPQIIK